MPQHGDTVRAREARAILPGWWAGQRGPVGTVVFAMLAPAEAAYRAAVALRNEFFDRFEGLVERPAVPVVSVGNLLVGGAGKTPFASWVIDELIHRGHRPALLHGGYAADEPELHRRWHPDVPVFAGKHRAVSAQAAAAAGASAVVMDDGFQHRRVARDLDWVLVPAENWTDRPHLLPRGPWREGATSLRRATHIVVTRRTAGPAQAAEVARAVAAHGRGAPVSIVRLAADGWTNGAAPARPPQGPAVAVAGVADPVAFAANARDAGARIERLLAYGDHHAYNAKEAALIRAVAAGRPIVTTEKDWIKLSRWIRSEEVLVLRQRVEPESGVDALYAALDGLPR